MLFENSEVAHLGQLRANHVRIIYHELNGSPPLVKWMRVILADQPPVGQPGPTLIPSAAVEFDRLNQSSV